MNRMTNILRTWLPLAVVVTGMSALVYIAVQQSLRQGANDPQIQLAEDTAAALEAGTSPAAAVPAGHVDLAKSLAPFVIVYDAGGKPIAGSGLLDGMLPDYPMGALSAAKAAENRVTWQPRGDVRIASVAVPYKDGYVVAGRSLLEVEKREAQAQTIALVFWALTLMAVAAVTAFGEVALRG